MGKVFAKSVACVTLMLLAGCGQQTDESVHAKSEALESSAQKGPVKVTVRVAPGKPRLSDLIDLDLLVTAPAGVEVKAPSAGETLGGFQVRDHSEKAERLEGENHVRDFHYQLEPLESGRLTLHPPPVSFIDKRANAESKDKPLVCESEALDVNVSSEVGAGAPSLADLAPVADPVALPSHRWMRWAAALGALALAALAFVFFKRREKVRVAALVQRSPEEIAQEELRTLIAKDLVAKGFAKEFYVELTGIVRRFIERKTGVRAPEQTTEEFLRDMRAHSGDRFFTEERSGRLADFLEAADMVKYAGMEPSERQIQESVARAQEFVGLPSALAPLPV